MGISLNYSVYIIVINTPYGTSGFPDGSVVKNLPAIQETNIHSLGQEDPLEKEMTIHSSILAWKTPWTEESGRVQFTEL